MALVESSRIRVSSCWVFGVGSGSRVAEGVWGFL
jgi:hypothetical protein